LTTIGLTNALVEPFFDLEREDAVALREYAAKDGQKAC
jgi:hypothetical protein